MASVANLPLLRQRAYLHGAWVGADDEATFAVISPSTGERLALVPDLGRVETRRAIEAAASAWPAWRDRPAKERAAVLRAWFALITDHRDELAHLMTHESGKVITESLGEVTYGASFVEWFAEEAKRAYGDVIPSPARDRRLVVLRQSIGVVAAITPWNFPLAMITRKVAPALAAGCPVVIKPAAETPLTALALAELADRAGFPPGVFNVVTTAQASAVGLELCEHPLVRKLSFTGSTAVGRTLMAQCAPSLTRLSLELGGNAPFLVFDDADLEAAVRGALAAKYRHAGQTCVCVNRLLVHDDVYDAFVARFTAAVAALRLGDVLDPGTQVGPLISERAVTTVDAHLHDALQHGATVAHGGQRLGGLFYQPTVLTGATSAMRIAQEEVFGPVAAIFRFSNEAEAIAMANDTAFGLAAYVYSRDIGRCWRVAEALEYGMVGVNEGLISTEVAPFGGIKASGMGREGSKYGLDAYLELKYVCFGGIDSV
ncbi:MAG: NAD-dependent succinate-semialdehyde dehydrogenase [Gemmatimonas sp.]|uniref:NAD-dependent succinate-semialdehyde dehydrogenase n=1 Tax=Gemmatimonas sp. TaxID=1962908 RepID=UPI00391F1CF6